MDRMTLYNIEHIPDDRAAIAYVAYNGRPFQIRLREINKAWLSTDLWWPMHHTQEMIVSQASKICLLFGASAFDIKTIGIRKYLWIGFPHFNVVDQVRDIFN